MNKRKKAIPFFLILLSLFIVRVGLSQYSIAPVITLSKCDPEGGEHGSISLNISGVSGPYTYLWSNGSTAPDLLNIRAGTYSVQIKNGLGQDTIVVFVVGQASCDPGPENVFTPNGDGINDTWFIQNAELYPNMLVSVFNRLGQRIYERKGTYVPWDGLSLIGFPVDGGVYYYIIYSDWNNTTDTGLVKGSVNIMR
jgi:gliding motility-associated-like protein